jgi:N-acetylglucosaminyldiphosphoundecaprenol N-acetyl-beta-D-mannosaminyltransferase
MISNSPTNGLRVNSAKLAASLTRQSPEEARANVLSVGIHAVNIPQAVELIEAALRDRRKGYVCVTSVHGVMEAQRRPHFREVLDRALLVAPDGMPTVWVGRWQGFTQMDRVFGPDLMLEVCRRSVNSGHTHFLYGGKPGVVEALRRRLHLWFPGIRIVGTFTPPFRALSSDEESALQETFSQFSPDIVWVGLSTPKQEQFMAEYLSRLDCRVMIGVGAAFDFHTGGLKDAPAWMKEAGLQWLHRLCQEPSRLGKRYLVNNSAFLVHILLQLTGLKRYRLATVPTISSSHPNVGHSDG